MSSFTLLRERLAGLLAAIRTRLRRPRPASAVKAGERSGRSGLRTVRPSTVDRIVWRPRDLTERLARRARQPRSQPRRTGANTGGHAVRDRYGSDFYSSIGARGGSTVLEERGVEYLQDIGARGGAATRRRYGPEHYAEIGRKGGLAGRGRKRPRKRPGQLELPLQG